MINGGVVQEIRYTIIIQVIFDIPLLPLARKAPTCKCTYTPRRCRCSDIAEHCVRRTCSRSMHTSTQCLSRTRLEPYSPRYRLNTLTNRPPRHATNAMGFLPPGFYL